jgi:protein-tyrosine phosphatase
MEAELEVPAPPERRIALEGSVNFRDVGGYPAQDGRETRWRTLFRADGLHKLTEADLELVQALDLRTVVDLRSAFELETGRFPVERIPVDFHHVAIIEVVRDKEAFKVAPGMMGQEYLRMLEEGASQIGRAVSLLAQPDALPAVVHCTAGKDRTGMVTAVVLGLLGVPHDVIVADYARSAEAMADLRAQLIARYPEGRDVIENSDELFAAQPAYMENLLATIEARFGSVAAFAAQAGVGEDEVAALRQALLV